MQIFGFENQPWAQGLEVGILFYLLLPGTIASVSLGSIQPDIVHSATAGLLYWGYNSFIKS